MTETALDVWMRFDSPDDEESSAEANTYKDDSDDAVLYRVEWYLTSVGQVTCRSFTTYEEAAAWLTAEGFQDFSAG